LGGAVAFDEDYMARKALAICHPLLFQYIFPFA
jgi:hypothetical protein